MIEIRVKPYAILGCNINGTHNALAHPLVRDGHSTDGDDEFEQLWPGEPPPELIPRSYHGPNEGG